MFKGESLACCGASRGAAVECLFDPVVGDALRAVGDCDRSTFAESEGPKRAPHRRVVLVGVAAQVVRVLSCEPENRPRDPTPTHRGHAVDDVVLSLGMPCADNLGVGLVWTGSERKDGERPLAVVHKEAVSACDVFRSVNPARVSLGPLSRIPIRLHERPSMRIRALNELEVLRESDLNPHAITISTNTRPEGKGVDCGHYARCAVG